jgi:hypothetical protein
VTYISNASSTVDSENHRTPDESANTACDLNIVFPVSDNTRHPDRLRKFLIEILAYIYDASFNDLNDILLTECGALDHKPAVSTIFLQRPVNTIVVEVNTW